MYELKKKHFSYRSEDTTDLGSDKYSCSSDTCLPASAVEIQSMFNDWKKSPQQRLADLVEALNLLSPLEEEEDSAGELRKDKKSTFRSIEKTVAEVTAETSPCDKQTCKCHPNKNRENTCCATVSSFLTILFKYIGDRTTVYS